MIFKVIKSGSTGNAVVLNKNILIDCGVPFVEIKEYINDLDIVLLTHRHLDHFNIQTLLKIKELKPHVQIFGNSELAEENEIITCVELNQKVQLGNITAYPIFLYHDAKNYGWRLKIGSEMALYIVDTHTLEGIKAKGYDYYFIESNYNRELLDENMENGSLNKFLYYRILKTHLDKEKCLNFFMENKKEGSQLIELHKSSTNYR